MGCSGGKPRLKPFLRNNRRTFNKATESDQRRAVWNADDLFWQTGRGWYQSVGKNVFKIPGPRNQSGQREEGSLFGKDLSQLYLVLRKDWLLFEHAQDPRTPRRIRRIWQTDQRATRNEVKTVGNPALDLHQRPKTSRKMWAIHRINSRRDAPNLANHICTGQLRPPTISLEYWKCREFTTIEWKQKVIF